MGLLLKIAVNIISGVYNLLFSWWLNPCLQRHGQKHLAAEIQQEFRAPFPLTIVREGHSPFQRFNYPTVQVAAGNMLLEVVRFQKEIPFTVGPRSGTTERYRLTEVIAALESTAEGQIKAPRTMQEANKLLQPHWAELDQLFSPASLNRRAALQLHRLDDQAPEPQLEWERKKRNWE